MPRTRTTSAPAELDPIEAELAALNAAQTKAAAAEMKVTGSRTVTVFYDTDKFAQAYRAVRCAYPDLKPDQKAVENAGKGKTGESQLMAVLSRPRGNGLPGANIKLYRSGKAVFVNCDPIAL